MKINSYHQPLNFNSGKVELVHGSGGKAMHQLIEELFTKSFNNSKLSKNDDGAVIDAKPPFLNSKIVISTDSHVVSPIFFPGGDIGSLSVYGTVNDVAVMGAKPLYICVGLIIEEGFPLSELKTIIESMAKSAKIAGVEIVCGDTKVVERDSCDQIFISTTGFGFVENPKINLSGANAKVGDKVILSGTIGDHGMAVLSKREGLEFSSKILSDSQSLVGLIDKMLVTCPQIRLLRDPTRGGLACTLNEITKQSNIGIVINENSIPINQEVEATCEFLGLDPLYVANEGKVVCICPENEADKILKSMRTHPFGRKSEIIGEVIEDKYGFVQMITKLGGKRNVDWLSGEQLPRIC